MAVILRRFSRKALQASMGNLAVPSFDLTQASDTGVSNSDHLTGNNMPSFEGQAPAGSTVAFYADGLLTGIAAADDQGSWSTMLNECQALADGARAITAQAFDDAGQVSALSPELAVTILTTAPDMPVITSALANSHAKGGRLVVSGTAAPGTTIKVIKEGRAVRARAQADAGGAWSATVGGLAAGPHTLRCATDRAAGNESPAFNDTVVTVDSAGGAGAGGGSAAGAGPDAAVSTASTTAAATSAPVIAMTAGDIACGTGSSGAACKQQATANILIANNPDVVMPLGDNQYECGLLGRLPELLRPKLGCAEGEDLPLGRESRVSRELDFGQPVLQGAVRRSRLLHLLRQRRHAPPADLHERLQGLLLVQPGQLAFHSC